jgi:DNA polymerase-3 subunit delta'
MTLPRPSVEEAQAWLRSEKAKSAVDLLPLLGNAPLLAVAETERGRGSILMGVLESLAEPGRDPLQLASRWQNQLQLKSEAGLPMDAFVQLFQKWLFDLALFKLSGRHRLGASRRNSIKQLTDKASAGALIRCYNDSMKFRALASHPLNPQLFLEDIAERYLRALATERS